MPQHELHGFFFSLIGGLNGVLREGDAQLCGQGLRGLTCLGRGVGGGHGEGMYQLFGVSLVFCPAPGCQQCEGRVPAARKPQAHALKAPGCLHILPQPPGQGLPEAFQVLCLVLSLGVCPIWVVPRVYGQAARRGTFRFKLTPEGVEVHMGIFKIGTQGGGRRPPWGEVGGRGGGGGLKGEGNAVGRWGYRGVMGGGLEEAIEASGLEGGC